MPRLNARRGGSVPGPWCAQIPDPRRAAGHRFDLVFVLGVVVMAALAGRGRLRGIRRWAANTDPVVLSALAHGGSALVVTHALESREDGGAGIRDGARSYTDTAAPIVIRFLGIRTARSGRRKARWRGRDRTGRRAGPQAGRPEAGRQATEREPGGDWESSCTFPGPGPY